MMRKQSGYSIAFSMGQSKKLMTQRLGDWSGRELRSSPLRYGNSTSLLRASLLDKPLGLLRCQHEAHAEDIGPLNDLPSFALRRCGLPRDRAGSSEEGGDAARRLIVQHEKRSPLALPDPNEGDFQGGHPGHGRLRTARGMTQLPSSSWSSPTSRVSPWAIVFVANEPS